MEGGKEGKGGEKVNEKMAKNIEGDRENKKGKKVENVQKSWVPVFGGQKLVVHPFAPPDARSKRQVPG